MKCKGYESKLQYCRLGNSDTQMTQNGACPRNLYAFVSCQKRCLATGTFYVKDLEVVKDIK